MPAAVRDLYPGYFAFVMASGIISTGAFFLGPSWLSRALLVVAAAAFLALGVTLLIRLVVFRAAVAALAAVTWLVLTYGVPASLLLTRGRESVLGGVNGSWLLWVVGTQSLSLAAATLEPAWPSQAKLLATAAAAFWSVGLMLYLLLVSLILLRWLTVPVTPETLGPSYWILMGSTAISVLAGAKILGLPAGLAVVRTVHAFVEGFSFALWAFGTWWIPLLIILGLWRHVRRSWPLTYEPTLWSVVFPLGMYGVASFTFGKAAHLA